MRPACTLKISTLCFSVHSHYSRGNSYYYLRLLIRTWPYLLQCDNKRMLGILGIMLLKLLSHLNLLELKLLGPLLFERAYASL